MSPETFISFQLNSPLRGQDRYGALAAREDRIPALGKLTSWAETIMGRTGVDECPGRAASLNPNIPGVPGVQRW